MAETGSRPRVTILSLIGVLLTVIGILLYVAASLLGLLRATILSSFIEKEFVEVILWYSPLPILLGFFLFLIGLKDVARKRKHSQIVSSDFAQSNLTVALTAYNDESSIGDAVLDFLNHPTVGKVIVISNNSIDGTMEAASEAGALVFNEDKQGYGACVKRAMVEACHYDISGTVVICEGDMTFRANDLSKLLPYLEHSDVVNGTRIVETLQANSTQLSLFMHYGNLFVAKLLEAKYFGDASITDVGTTYKIARTECLESMLNELDSNINLEFNPYFLEQVISRGFRLVEVPITFHPRVGVSKGGNISNVVAFKLGVRMIFGIVFGWRLLK